MSNFTIQVEKYCIDDLVWFAASGVQLTIVKMNALYLIKKIGATDYKQYYSLNLTN